MKPYLHAKVSVAKWGGKPEDYQAIHDFLDSSKAAHADMRHRTILHNTLGCYIAERVFGINITNSEGKLVSVRDIAEQHIIDDMGRIPSLSDYLNDMPFYDWLGGRKAPVKEMSFDELDKKLEPVQTPQLAPVIDSEATRRHLEQMEERKKRRQEQFDRDPRIID